jgi:hypothetical protein
VLESNSYGVEEQNLLPESTIISESNAFGVKSHGYGVRE